MFISVGKLVSWGTEVNQCAALLFGCHISLYWMSMWTDMLAWSEISVNVLLGQVVCDPNAAGKKRGEFCYSCFLIVQWDVGFLHTGALCLTFVVLQCTNYCSWLPEYNDWPMFFEFLRLSCTVRTFSCSVYPNILSTSVFNLRWMKREFGNKMYLWWIFLYSSVCAGISAL